ncbi:hypothetical protein SmJEL517_g05948 [Synchytrium microbalum]|uniref:Uncharacterized protein n=1 Tax=Synchytrium microbalum TaxID=1806994 RepID=A0A507BXN3_9FUNG|nr:uncharacterized protein SmJEL517_g05948 [Synchytrium microbalum]TPX30486.1 hypothetical protein SmJEL517_g05948 [Synchytrium microbalum]
MIANEEPDIDLTPHVSTDAGNFFQSDRDIAKQEARDLKKSIHANSGLPISIPSKVLDLQFAGTGSDADLSANKLYAYVAESGHVARKYNLMTGKWSKAFKGHTGPVTTVAIALNAAGQEEVVVTGSWDKGIRKWNALTGECLLKMTAHTDFVKKVVIHKNLLFSASVDTTIRIWDLQTGRLIRTLKEHTRGVEDILLFEDGKRLASASSDGSIKIWDVQSGQVLVTLTGHLTSVYRLGMNEEGDQLWSASADKTLKRWDLNTGLEDTSLEHPDFVKAVAVSDRYVFTGCRDEIVRVWDAATDQVVRTMDAHSDEVSAVALRGSVLWSGSIDATIRRWDVSDLIGGTADLSLFDGTMQIDEVPGPGEGSDSTVPASGGDSGLTAEEEAELAELMD